jgi:hypothetical protein
MLVTTCTIPNATPSGMPHLCLRVGRSRPRSLLKTALGISCTGGMLCSLRRQCQYSAVPAVPQTSDSNLVNEAEIRSKPGLPGQLGGDHGWGGCAATATGARVRAARPVPSSCVA